MIESMNHVGVVVDDLAAAVDFFVALGLEAQGESAVEGEWVDRIVGLDGIRVDAAMVKTADGHGQLELIKFHSPAAEGDDPRAPANFRGLRHVAFVVDDIDATVARAQELGSELIGEVVQYEEMFRLGYIRGPEGIIVELAERLG